MSAPDKGAVPGGQSSRVQSPFDQSAGLQLQARRNLRYERDPAALLMHQRCAQFALERSRSLIVG